MPTISIVTIYHHSTNRDHPEAGEILKVEGADSPEDAKNAINSFLYEHSDMSIGPREDEKFEPDKDGVYYIQLIGYYDYRG